MRIASAVLVFASLAKAYARGPEADCGRNAQCSCERLAETLTADSVHKHVKAMMADPAFEEQIKNAAEQVEAVLANRTLQEQMKSAAEQIKADPSFQEQAKQLTKQMNALMATTVELEPGFQKQVMADMNSHAFLTQEELAAQHRSSVDSLLDDVVNNVLRRARQHSRTSQGADLERVTVGKSSSLATPNSGVRRPTLASRRPHPAVVPLGAARSQFGYRSPGASVNNSRRSTHGSDALNRESTHGPWQEIENLRGQALASATAFAFAMTPHIAWAADAATTAVNDNRFARVDKTGPIGNAAAFLEQGLDQVHASLEGAGMTSNTYGLSIALFTILVRSLALPLTYVQVSSSLKTQQMNPYREKIAAAFPDKSQEQIKTQLVGQLFSAAKVNPLAGCFPALVQIPVFISLYRCLSNQVAEGKLNEGFLWLPSLEAPIYGGTASNWFSSIFTTFGTRPALGWHDTALYLTLPAILIATQTVSTKFLKPAREPGAELTDQEKQSDQIANFLPFMIAYFSTNVPSGLGIYWVTSNLMTTIFTLALKAGIKQDDLPPEVFKIMESVEERQKAARTLVWASKMGNMDALKELLAEGRDPNEVDELGRTALHFAAGSPYESVPLLTALIDAKASLDVKDPADSTPLHYAAGYGRLEIARALIDAGALPTLKKGGQSPADLARIGANMTEGKNPVARDAALMARLECSQATKEFANVAYVPKGEAPPPPNW
jgi:YidC/Oxa1 family membrane protein insertase